MYNFACVFVNTCAVKDIPIIVGKIYKKKTAVYSLCYGIAIFSTFLPKKNSNLM